MLDKYAHLHHLIFHIYSKYKAVSYPGTDISQQHLGTVEPTPVPGGPGRGQHKLDLAPCGPI
eukprot:6915302-Karenia_brevis.AAC.1